MPAALVAALLLLLQSSLGAFAFGAPSQLDAFGNVICTHEGAVKLPGGDPHQHSDPPPPLGLLRARHERP